MNILYDGQIFDEQNIGGISRYFFELMTCLGADKEISYSLPILYSDNIYLKQLQAVQNLIQPVPEQINYYKKFLWGTEFSLKPKLYTLKKKLAGEKEIINGRKKNRELSIERLKKGNFDLFHPTYYESYFLDFIGTKPFVLTVYDLIHQIFPEFLLYDNRDKTAVLLDKAAKIIAISESTKKDLVNIFDIPEEKIAVTYLGNSLSPKNPVVFEDFTKKIPAKYILFVGGRWGYKNFLFFAQLMSGFFKSDPHLHVVCTGQPFGKDENELFRKTGYANRFHQTFVNDDELIYLYQKAIAFIFPSQYEGFGLPIVEALSLGCPVLASNTSSLIEIGGEGVFYFEPKNAGSLLKAIQSVLSNTEEKERKKVLGFEQAKQFTWEQTCTQTKSIYRQAVNAVA